MGSHVATALARTGIGRMVIADFDTVDDPHQERPIDDPARTAAMLGAMARLFAENDAPAELYRRYGLQKPESEA